MRVTSTISFADFNVFTWYIFAYQVFYTSYVLRDIRQRSFAANVYLIKKRLFSCYHNHHIPFSFFFFFSKEGLFLLYNNEKKPVGKKNG